MSGAIDPRADIKENIEFRDISTAKPLLSDREHTGHLKPWTGHSLPRSFKQPTPFIQGFTKSLSPGLVRCFISWLIIGGFWTSLWVYKGRILSPRAKSMFDAITVALSIAFGLNISSSLKGVVLDLRWWILSMRKRPSREAELILHGDSMTDLLRLMFVAPRPGILLVCGFWLSLNMLIQVGIAVLGLTYSATPGNEDIYRDSRTNNMSIPDMSRFTRPGRFSDGNLLQGFAAHVLGDIGSSYNISQLPEVPLEGKPWASNPAGFWNATDHWEYVFLDSAPIPQGMGSTFLAIYSNRSVKSSGICTTPPYNVTKSGQLAIVNYTEASTNRTYIFPGIALGVESVYYLTQRISDNGPSSGSCGPGCSSVQALEPAAGPPESSPPNANISSPYYFYDCNITITSSSSELPVQVAALAAQSIASSGQIHQEFLNTDQALNQYVPYNFGAPFGEPQNNSATGMASQMSRFAMGSIAAAAQNNPRKFVEGQAPAQGLRLQIDSLAGFVGILGFVAVVQLLLVLVAATAMGRMGGEVADGADD